MRTKLSNIWHLIVMIACIVLIVTSLIEGSDGHYAHAAWDIGLVILLSLSRDR
jgi:hypothetical protein